MLTTIKKALLFSSFIFSFVCPMNQIVRLAVVRTLGQTASFRNSLLARYPGLIVGEVVRHADEDVKTDEKSVKENIEVAKNEIIVHSYTQNADGTFNHMAASLDPKMGKVSMASLDLNSVSKAPCFNKNVAMDLLQRYTYSSGGSVAPDHQLQSHTDRVDTQNAKKESQNVAYLAQMLTRGPAIKIKAVTFKDWRLELSDRFTGKSKNGQEKVAELKKKLESWSNYDLQKLKEDYAKDLAGDIDKLLYEVEQDPQIFGHYEEEKKSSVIIDTRPRSIPLQNGTNWTDQQCCKVEKLSELKQSIDHREEIIAWIEEKSRREARIFANQLKNADNQTLEEKIIPGCVAKEEAFKDVIAQWEKNLIELHTKTKQKEAELKGESSKSKAKKCNAELQSLYADVRMNKAVLSSLRAQLEETSKKTVDAKNFLAARQEVEAEKARHVKEQQDAERLHTEQVKIQHDSLDLSSTNCPDSVQGERQEALSQTEKDGYQEYDQDYSLSPQAAAYLKKRGIDISQVHNFRGTTFQHQLHGEYCNIVEKAAAKQAQLYYESDLLTECVTCAGSAYDANKLGCIKTVVALNNLGFGLLESVHAVVTVVRQIAESTAYVITHPEEAIKSLSNTALYALETIALNQDNEQYGCKDWCAPLRDQRNAEISAGLQKLKSEFQQLTGLQKVKSVTRFVAEWIMAKHIMSANGTIMGIPKGTTVQVSRFLKPGRDGSKIKQMVATMLGKNVELQKIGSAAQKVKSVAALETNVSKVKQMVATILGKTTELQKGASGVANTAQKLEAAIAQEKIVETVAAELMEVEKSIEKSAKVVSGHSIETIRNQAHNVNAQAALDKKLRVLQKAQKEAVRIEHLPDGRIRYYELEAPSKTPGPTRGRSQVVEFNPKTGSVRGWSECYDHAGDVNRVNPKFINGQDIVGQHYPPTYTDIQNMTKTRN